jgi:hypothetical protein
MLPVDSLMADDPENEVTVDALVAQLILLERDATAAYVRILHRLEDAGARQEIARLIENRQRRLASLTMLSFTLRSASPDEVDATHYLPVGRVAIETLSGDQAILTAMLMGEAATVDAYQRASAHPQASAKCRAVFERAYRDAVQHLSSMQEAARALNRS